MSGCEWREVETRKNVEKRLEEWKTGEEGMRLEKIAESFVYCEGMKLSSDHSTVF